MQKIPLAKHFYKVLLPLYPLTFESFDFSKYDLVISSTTRFAKSIITGPKTIHIAYVNTVPRFLWDKKLIRQYLPFLLIFLFTPIFTWLKRWDTVASNRVDFYIANSKNVQKRIKKSYNRESKIIYPYAAINFFKVAKIHNWQLKSKNYYLIVSRLIRWKRIEIAIRTFNDLKMNLVIIGEGPDKKRLQKIANHNIEFMGRVSIEDLRALYQNCQALIVTQEEDFGIAVVEAQSCAKPVIAYRQGGVKEIIIENKTGVFYHEQSPKSLKDAITRSSSIKWNERQIRINALKFSKSIFVAKFKGLVQNYVQ